MGAGAVIRRILSIAGFSLSFALRRMETIVRMAWLPVSLLFILAMATVFIKLSIAAERPLSFGDYTTYFQAVQELRAYEGLAWANNPTLMFGVNTGSFLIQWILIASFMAPLIRYAGLGERPGPGVVKLPFGMDQIRFMLGYFLSFLVLPALLIAPVAISAPYVVKAVNDVMALYYASFPNPDSLHTVDIIPAAEILGGEGKLWYYLQGVPVAAAAPLAVLLWFVLFRHFRPRGDQPRSAAKTLLRAGGTLVASVGLSAWLWFAVIAKAPEQLVIAFIPMVSTFFPGVTFQAAQAVITHMLVLLPIVFAFIGYANLRALPYTGIAVCRRSFAFAGLGRVTRSWRLVWTMLALGIVAGFTYLVQYAINVGLGFVGSSLSVLLTATESATRLANSGETGDWVLPAFITTWNIIRILAIMLSVFFSYGVFAGLLGRLYRESEAEEA